MKGAVFMGNTIPTTVRIPERVKNLIWKRLRKREKPKFKQLNQHYFAVIRQ